MIGPERLDPDSGTGPVALVSQSRGRLQSALDIVDRRRANPARFDALLNLHYKRFYTRNELADLFNSQNHDVSIFVVTTAMTISWRFRSGASSDPYSRN